MRSDAEWHDYVEGTARTIGNGVASVILVIPLLMISLTVSCIAYVLFFLH